MAVTGTLILETFVKWIIPFICAAIVGLIAARLINPIKKGNDQQKKEEWERIARSSNVHEEICGKHFAKIQEQSNAMDTQILAKLNAMDEKWQTDISALHNQQLKNAEEIDAVRQGVLDAHLQNLITACNTFIEHGYITHAELIQYNQRLAVYHKLGGNGHMDLWDERIRALPVHN